MSTASIEPDPALPTVDRSTFPVKIQHPRTVWTAILRETRQHPWIGLAVGIAGVAAIAVAGAVIGSAMDRSIAGFLLVVPVVLAGVIGGRWASYAVAICAALSYSLRLPPLDSPRVAVAEDIVALGALLAVSLLVSALVTGRIEALTGLEQDRAVLLRSVSHDLRTPLGTIRAAATDLLDESAGEPDRATRRHMLQLIDHDARRLDRLVSNLLSLSRIEAVGMRPQREATDPGALTRSAVERAELANEGVSFRLEAPPDLPMFDVDPVMIDQVLTNLLDNAVRHSPPHEAIDVSVTTADRGRQVVMSVADRGPGVPPEEMELIFLPFRSGRIAGSSGVGLAISRAIVNAHGGTISVHERQGGGAQFEVVIGVH